MRNMKENDLVVILADNVRGTIDTIRRFSADADGAR
jgi:hypothetical protein